MLIARFMTHFVREKRHSSIYLIAFSSIILSLMLTACNSATDTAKPFAQPSPNVKVAQAISKEMTQWDEYTGRIEAVNEVQLRSRVSGYIEKVQFAAGAKVKKGDLLFLIDNKPYKSQLNFANAEQEKAKVKYELAKNDLARADKLVAEKAISAEEFDMRSHAVRETSAILESAQASVYAAQLNVSYCEIRAPISGRISREVLTEGNLVNTSDNTVLATIVSLDPVYVYVDADERSILNYRTQNTNHDLNGSPVSLELTIDAQELDRGGCSYTFDTLTSLRHHHSQTLLLFIGSDAFNHLTTWYRWQEIFDLAHVVVITRPDTVLNSLSDFFKKRLIHDKKILKKYSAGGLFFQEITQLAISATAIRGMIAAGCSPRFLLPDAVIDYITQHQLYKE